MQIFIHSHAQLEDDTLGNIQPVKVTVEDATKTAVEFPCTSDDAGGSVEDPLSCLAISLLAFPCDAVIFVTG